jgi:carboxylesterase
VNAANLSAARAPPCYRKNVARPSQPDPRLSAFDLGRGPTALLVHGFTGTPFEMRYLGGHLARHGFRALGVRLPGHGLDPFALERTTAMDWVNEARAALLDQPQGQKAHLVGLSMGALIAALLAADHPERVASLSLCAPALYLSRTRSILMHLTALRLLSPRLRFLPKRASDLHDPRMRARLPSIGVTPAAAAGQFGLLRAWARRALPRVAAPVLIAYSELDKTVPVSAVRACARLVGSRPVRMVRLTRSSHVVTLDVERARVAEEIEGFLREAG